MIEERLTDEERQMVVAALLTCRLDNERLLGALRKIEGTDTVVVCQRAYSSTREGSRR